MGGWERELSWRSIQGWRHRVVITCCSRSVSCPGYLLWSVRPTLGHSQTLQSYAEMGKPYPSPASIFISKRRCWRNSLDVVGCKKIDRWRPLTSAAFVLILSNCMWHLHTDIILLNNFEKKKKRGTVPQICGSVYVNSAFENRYIHPDSKKSTQWFGYWNTESFFSSLRFSRFLSFKFRFSGCCVLPHMFSTSPSCFLQSVPEPPCSLKIKERLVHCIFIIFLMKSENGNFVRMWIGYQPTDRHGLEFSDLAAN